MDRRTHTLELGCRTLSGAVKPFRKGHGSSLTAHQLQERTQGGASRALRRRLHRLTGELEKDGGSFDPRLVPRIGTTLAREWRGRTHVVQVREDGFEYEDQPYRSLSVIAKRITLSER